MDKMKILLVDDDPDFLGVIKKRLEVSGFTVVTASSGEEALDAFAREKPSAILLDILMPGVNGLEVLGTIRKANRNIPIFITTAFTSEERFKMANQLNATGFIMKTMDFKEQIANIIDAIKLAEKYST